MRLAIIVLKVWVTSIFVLLFVTRGTLVTAYDVYNSTRAYTRMIEFDYIDWALRALLIKHGQESVNVARYLSDEEQRETVLEYLRLVNWVNRTTAEVDRIYANPDIANPGLAAADLNEQLNVLRDMENRLKPIAESIIQHQVSVIVAEEGLGAAGQPVPPVLYHTTRLPRALIVSPRDQIRQDANISISPDLTTEEMSLLEADVEEGLDVSSLVVSIGGVGIYPTMVMQTTHLPFLVEVVAHEWIHNYLTLRPLGVNYMTSAELRTINETTANIAGKEIGDAVLRRYYPEMAPPPTPSPTPTPEDAPQMPAPTPTPEDPTIFSYTREMRITRIQVDELLAEGKIEEAEAYMEERRRFFWDNGYQIRRINQAFFAFHGAYADSPGGGAAGRDPVGPAVQELRQRSDSLAAFLNRISWVTSFEQLQRILDE
jgi:hypothetical protein